MIASIFNALFEIINKLLGIILSPINTFLDSFFPDLDSYISNFVNICNGYLANMVGYFFNFIPPMTRGLLIIIFTFFISYKAVVWSYHATIYVFNIIRKIKFW